MEEIYLVDLQLISNNLQIQCLETLESGVGRKLVQKKRLLYTDNKISLNFSIVVLLCSSFK